MITTFNEKDKRRVDFNESNISIVRHFNIGWRVTMSNGEQYNIDREGNDAFANWLEEACDNSAGLHLSHSYPGSEVGWMTVSALPEEE